MAKLGKALSPEQKLTNKNALRREGAFVVGWYGQWRVNKIHRLDDKQCRYAYAAKQIGFANLAEAVIAGHVPCPACFPDLKSEPLAEAWVLSRTVDAALELEAAAAADIKRCQTCQTKGMCMCEHHGLVANVLARRGYVQGAPPEVRASVVQQKLDELLDGGADVNS